MSFTAAESRPAGRQPAGSGPGRVLVADEILLPGKAAVPCPAAVLLEGELGRRGIRVERGQLRAGAAHADRALGAASGNATDAAADADARAANATATSADARAANAKATNARAATATNASAAGISDDGGTVGARGAATASGISGTTDAATNARATDATGAADARGAATASGTPDPTAAALHTIFPATGGQAGFAATILGDASAELLAEVHRAAAAWLAAVGRTRTLVLASPRSFCAGVERAIEIVERLLVQRGGPIHVRKQIVHNKHVVAGLEARGAVFVEELGEVPLGATVVFSAHGVSPAVRAEAELRRLEVIDATCPLVTKVHTEARRFAGHGHTVLLIGHEGHEEVEGTLGEAPEQTILVQSVEEALRTTVPDPAKVSYLTQTTLGLDEATEIITALRTRFPALRGPASDDICYATTNRQDALREIATESDVVLVVGSRNSSNSVRLVELAARGGTPAHLIDDARDIRPEWLVEAGTVGLTAGASAPPRLVQDVIDAIGGLGPITVEERETTRETIQFTLPVTVRS